jgi:hypothetical protein
MKGIELAQSRPADTNAASVVSPDESEVIHITELIICNTTNASAAYRVFKDEDGTTYDQTTAHFYDVALPANTTDVIEYNVWMNDSSGNLAVRTDTASAITFTVHGQRLQK